VRSWRGKHRNEGISEEPCVDRAEVSYLLLETPALLVDELRRIPLPRTLVNKHRKESSRLHRPVLH
jgi:hypothetical protein